MLLLLLTGSLQALAGEPEVAEVLFDQDFVFNVPNTGQWPTWISQVRQDQGLHDQGTGSWNVGEEEPLGAGLIRIDLDRSRLTEDLALAVMLGEHSEDADVVIQLKDFRGNALVIDLFANLVETVKIAQTEWAVVPLRRFPEATSIVIRRVAGELNIHGFVAFPIVSQQPLDRETEEDLANLLGDAVPKGREVLSFEETRIGESEVAKLLAGMEGKGFSIPPQPFQVSTLKTGFAIAALGEGMFRIEGNTLHATMNDLVIYMQHVGSNHEWSRNIHQVYLTLRTPRNQFFPIEAMSNKALIESSLGQAERLNYENLSFRIPLDNIQKGEMDKYFLTLVIQTVTQDDRRGHTYSDDPLTLISRQPRNR